MPKFLKPLLFVFIVTISILPPVLAQTSNLATATLSKVEVEKWRQDLRFMADELPRRHKNLFHSMTREQFDGAVKRLDERLPSLSRNQIIVEFMRILTMVKDGHTGLQGVLTDPKINFRTFPLTLYLYKDGLFVQTADPKYTEAIGGRVVRIGNATADEAFRTVSDLVFHDNEMGIKEAAPYLLVTPEVLQSVGIINDMENASFVIERDGRQFTIELKPTNRATPVGHNAFFVKPAEWIDARDGAQSPLPLYLKDPLNLYWFEYLAETKTIYVQYNGVQNKPDESIEVFAKRLFDFVGSHPVDRLILDMRNNGGGNNYLNRPLLLGILKSKIDERGKFFTIIGRRTFSAAQSLINELDKYTNAIFVGEPTGENVNHFGDPAHIELPNSGLVIRASTLWWQVMDPRDLRKWTGPNIAAELTSTDYRNNIDPAMNAIAKYVPKKELTAAMIDALTANNVELAKKLFWDFKNDPANAYTDSEGPVNVLGYRLMELQRMDQAIEIFKLNVEAFPKSGNTYDSLGEAYMKAGNKDLAIRNYEKAIELDPSNVNAINILKRLREK